MRTKTVKVNDKFQTGYKYQLTEPVGRNFHPDFKPEEGEPILTGVYHSRLGLV